MGCPNKEPSTITAGYSTEWTRSLSSYPNASHTLQYVFRRLDGVGTATTVTATTEGISGYLVTLAPSVTALLSGDYQLIGYITDDETGGDIIKTVVYDSTIQVNPDPLAATSGDRRTHVRRTRDLLRSAFERLVSGSISSASVNGKSYTKRSLSEIRMELARYEELLRIEEQKSCGKNIFVRFNRT